MTRSGEEDPRDFGAILAEFEQQQAAPLRQRDPEPGEKVSGRIVSIGDDAAFVDIGAKAEGLVRLAELTDEEGELAVGVGDTVEALVSATDEESGAFLLRVRPGAAGGVAGGRLEEAQAELRQAHEHGIAVEGSVTEVVKGGVRVQVAGLTGFCPISQLDLRYVEDPSEYVGRRLSFRILRYEEGRGAPNVVLSRRALLEEEARARAEETRARLEEGAVVQGTVTSLAGYGAFVDLGGLEGLLHVSEIGHGRIDHPQDVLAVGQVVDVKIKRIEPPREGEKSERISLSLKALEQDPWEVAAERFREGTVAQGRVVRLEPYGAFVELAPGVDGLVHVSELAADRRVSHPREVVAVDETVEVKVLKVDAERRRISLSMTAAAAEAEGSEAAAVKEYYRREGQEGAGFGSLGDFFKKARERGEE